MTRRVECQAGIYHWWCLARYASDYAGEFDRPKIVYQEITTHQSFAYDDSGAYANNKVFIIPDADLALLGVLNSSAVWEWLTANCPPLSGGALAMQRPFLSRVPVPAMSDSDRSILRVLVQKCLDARGVGCEEWEKEIDERVEALYGL